jgi:hypothetical protein
VREIGVQGLLGAYLELTSDNARPDAIKTILVLQNSRMVDEALAVVEANSIKNKGINIVGLGVGPDLDINQVRQIATDPSLVQQVTTQQLASFATLLLNAIQSFCPACKYACTYLRNECMNLMASS